MGTCVKFLKFALHLENWDCLNDCDSKGVNWGTSGNPEMLPFIQKKIS